MYVCLTDFQSLASHPRFIAAKQAMNTGITKGIQNEDLNWIKTYFDFLLGYHQSINAMYYKRNN